MGNMLIQKIYSKLESYFIFVQQPTIMKRVFMVKAVGQLVEYREAFLPIYPPLLSSLLIAAFALQSKHYRT